MANRRSEIGIISAISPLPSPTPCISHSAVEQHWWYSIGHDIICGHFARLSHAMQCCMSVNSCLYLAFYVLCLAIWQREEMGHGRWKLEDGRWQMQLLAPDS